MCIQEIAAIIGPDGASIPLNEAGNVVVYRHVLGSWQKDREMAFVLSPLLGLRELRRQMEDLKSFLRDCRVFVAQSASGALYFELEKARCSVWEIAGTPDQFLDNVWRDEIAEQATVCLPAGAGTTPAPIETSPGNYTISIREIQGNRPEVSSKQVLQQFIQRGEFLVLEITCSHVPPWIEVEAERRGYVLEIEKPDKETVKVRLTTKI
ncbi:Fe-only nitrogenase accessory AnfO family protein [Methanoregula sp.]|uniref:Fe-only nitrogenase accessory AnfO family protein n=1 Tax=Methanoregula sp. TaxID=2052170 RepID=UPI003BB084C2